jgi:hypothetical protein
MAQQDELFELIQSLSPTEKRYFKLHADSYSYGGYKKQYEKLYDALHNWPEQEYDEKEFKKKNKGKAFLKNLPSDKNYLRELILKVMRNYHSDNDPEIQLSEMLANIHILINKGLKAQAYKMIEKAIKLAMLAEQYNHILIIDDYLVSLFAMNPIGAEYDAAKIKELDTLALSKIALTKQTVTVQMNMSVINTLNQWKDKAEEVKEMIKEADAIEAKGGLTRRAELYLLNIKQYYLMSQKRFDEILSITASWLDKVENATSPYEYSSDQYRVTLANYMNCALKMSRLDILPASIAKLKAFKTTTEREEVNFFVQIASYEIAYVTETSSFEQLSVLIEYIEKGIDKYKRRLTDRRIVSIRCDIAIMLFVAKRFNDALNHISKVNFIIGRHDTYQTEMTRMRVLEWMCQYSTGAHDILDSSLRNLKRFFNDRQMKDPFFDDMFELFAVMIKYGNSDKHIKPIKERFWDKEPENYLHAQIHLYVKSWLGFVLRSHHQP